MDFNYVSHPYLHRPKINQDLTWTFTLVAKSNHSLIGFIAITKYFCYRTIFVAFKTEIFNNVSLCTCLILNAYVSILNSKNALRSEVKDNDFLNCITFMASTFKSDSFLTQTNIDSGSLTT